MTVYSDAQLPPLHSMLHVAAPQPAIRQPPPEHSVFIVAPWPIDATQPPPEHS